MTKKFSFEVENVMMQLNDVSGVDGDLVHFGNKHMDGVLPMARFAVANNRTFIGMNFVQYSDMESEFKRAHLYNYEFNTRIPNKICFAIIDVDAQINVSDILDLIWERMEYGGCIIISNYSTPIQSNTDMHVKKFIQLHRSEITTAHQRIVSHIRKKSLAIKCFPVAKRMPVDIDSSSLTIATVLKSGGDFGIEYVNHIADSVKLNSTIPYNFVCLTDVRGKFSPNVNKVIRLKHNWPKWWSKIELFAPGKFSTNKILYMDLDTMIVDNIDDILQFSGEFMALRDFNTQCELASGVMAWKNFNPKAYQIYEKFMENPTYYMNSFNGDQDFMRTVSYIGAMYMQDSYPNKIVSYKRNCVGNSEITIPDQSSIICFHGKPRPHQINNPILKKFWLGG